MRKECFNKRSPFSFLESKEPQQRKELANMQCKWNKSPKCLKKSQLKLIIIKIKFSYRLK
jgi:hypothetical protein